MVVFVPPKKQKGSKIYRVSDSSFKVYIRNLRTRIESSTYSANFNLVKVADLASFNFDIFKHLNAQVKRIGNVSQNRNLGLSLLGLEGPPKELSKDQLESNGKPVSQDKMKANPDLGGTDVSQGPVEVSQQKSVSQPYDLLGARPKRTIAKPVIQWLIA